MQKCMALLQKQNNPEDREDGYLENVDQLGLIEISRYELSL